MLLFGKVQQLPNKLPLYLSSLGEQTDIYIHSQ